MQDLIDKVQGALGLLQEVTEKGSLTIRLASHPDIERLQIEIDGDYVIINVYERKDNEKAAQ